VLYGIVVLVCLLVLFVTISGACWCLHLVLGVVIILFSRSCPFSCFTPVFRFGPLFFLFSVVFPLRLVVASLLLSPFLFPFSPCFRLFPPPCKALSYFLPLLLLQALLLALPAVPRR